MLPCSINVLSQSEAGPDLQIRTNVPDARTEQLTKLSACLVPAEYIFDSLSRVSIRATSESVGLPSIIIADATGYPDSEYVSLAISGKGKSHFIGSLQLQFQLRTRPT